MTRSVDSIISSAISVDGCANPIAYDKNHEISYGYWICTVCASQFFSGGGCIHNQDCSIKDKTPGLFAYKHPMMMYVLGDNDNGTCASFQSCLLYTSPSPRD